MNLRSELEEHAQSMQERIAAQLQEIHQIQETVVTLDDRISALQNEINRINKLIEPQINELAAKKELMAQWKSALAEHENRLLANQTLIGLQTAIENSHATIEEKLAELEKQKASVSDSITQFHQDHPYISPSIEDKLNSKLREQQAELESVSEQIAQLYAIQANLNFIVKIFLGLLQSFGWRTDPLADEQKKLLSITEEMVQISRQLDEYSTKKQEIDDLQDQAKHISTERRQLLNDEAVLQQIEASKRAISESQQTIKQLNIQIKNTSSECSTLQKQISNKKLDKKLRELQELVQEKNTHMDLVKEKSLQLSDIDSPRRAALKTSLKDALLQITAHQEQYRQDQSTHPKTQFFKPAATIVGTRDTPNYLALAKIQLAIKKFQTGLEPSSQEYRLLSRIGTKLLLWQMAESTTHERLSMQERNSAHQVLNAEIAELITELPIDNPLHATKHYIATLTLPLAAVEDHTSKKSIR
ncbi:MAG: hypothetical protein KBB94_09185 [Legionellaceae bacterium]|nr:hypothetical protein [Legionellaceae bacterium]MBP9774567.1 hypothetical protein [Legionellaceae bacterium]